jgi:5-formyltetrahydrofolate cyclo-ligase
VPKRSLRNSMLQQRRQLPETEVMHRSYAVQHRLLCLDVYRQAQTIALYSPVHNEVSTLHLLRDALADHRSVVMPRVVDADLEFRRVASLEDLAPGCFGILEPRPETSLVELGELELIVLPGVAFDRYGHRLGYGKGFYDRTLLATGRTCRRVGIGYDFQLVKKLPTFDHDMPLDLLVTESEVLAFGPDHST